MKFKNVPNLIRVGALFLTPLDPPVGWGWGLPSSLLLWRLISTLTWPHLLMSSWSWAIPLFDVFQRQMEWVAPHNRRCDVRCGTQLIGICLATACSLPQTNLGNIYVFHSHQTLFFRWSSSSDDQICWRESRAIIAAEKTKFGIFVAFRTMEMPQYMDH